MYFKMFFILLRAATSSSMTEVDSKAQLHVTDAGRDLLPVQQFHQTEKASSAPELPVRIDSSANDVHITEKNLSNKQLSVTEMVIKSTKEINSHTRENVKVQKKRHYREEWKIARNDYEGTKDRKENLIIDAADSWGVWYKVCTQWAPKLGAKFCTNFVKNNQHFKSPQPKKETVDSHFNSISHRLCLEKAKSSMIHNEDATIYKKLVQIDKKISRR